MSDQTASPTQHNPFWLFDYIFYLLLSYDETVLLQNSEFKIRMLGVRNFHSFCYSNIAPTDKPV